jgi:hypothetical protein
MLFSRIKDLLSCGDGSKSIFAMARMHSFFLLLTVVFMASFGSWLVHQARSYRQVPGADDSRYGYQGLPIVSQNSAISLGRYYYSADKNKYVYLLDWYSVSKDNQQYYYLSAAALSRNYFPGYAQYAKGFLATHNAFLVLQSLQHPSAWLQMRIKDNPGYKFKVLGKTEDGGELILVERVL